LLLLLPWAILLIENALIETRGLKPALYAPDLSIGQFNNQRSTITNDSLITNQ